MSSAMEKITRAKVGLVLDQPFFGQLLCQRLRLVEEPSVETMATDGRTIVFNPEFVDKLSLDETKGVIAHEIMHVALCHHVRRGNRNHTKWNMACDYAINPLVLKSFSLPDGCLVSPAFDMMSAEEVYSQLPDSSGNDGQGAGFGSGGIGEVLDMPGAGGGQASSSERAQEEADVRVSVAQAAQSAKIRGKLPAGMERIIDGIINPSVNWRVLLRDFMERVVKNDYTWTRPNRRYITYGFYLPDLHSKDLGNIKVAIDTSGSVSNQEMESFAGEVSGILSEFPGCSVDVMYCDSKYYEDATQHFEHEDLPITLEAKGGGGTDFRPIFEAVAESGEKPTALIYLTDMCGLFPDEEPGYPVFWGATGNYDGEVPFGELVHVRTE